MRRSFVFRHHLRLPALPCPERPIQAAKYWTDLAALTAEATDCACRGLRFGLAVAQARDYVIDRYSADGMATFVYYGQAVQIVFVE